LTPAEDREPTVTTSTPLSPPAAGRTVVTMSDIESVPATRDERLVNR
jgi:hypothetical protein